ncbi:glycosyltransferase family 39 protein [Candidatus Bathyarchaeota archaeon]|nr:glycosyltransferase family 39 protein [Candidatus Bathyarchaeota archaeon]
MKVKDTLIHFILLLAPCMINGAVYAATFASNPFPPIDDPAIWLKNAYALLGNTYPLWDQTVLQYPPFFNLILAALILLTNSPLLVLKSLGIVLISLLPLSIYPLVKYITGKRFAGIFAAWLLAFHPIFAEMYGWGGYPNILAIAFLLLALYFMLRSLNHCKRTDIVLTSVLSTLVVVTHHLTTIVYAVGCLTFLIIIVYDYMAKGSLGMKSYICMLPMAASFISFLIWRVLAGPFQYVTYNYASLAVRPFDLEAFWWIFKDPTATVLLFVLAALGSITLYFTGKRRELLLLLALTVFPFIFTQAYLIGLALDFKRFPSFAVPFIIALASSPFTLLSKDLFSFDKKGAAFSTNIGGALLASVLLATLIFNVGVGVNMPYKINEYYHYIHDWAYGIEEKLELLNWLRDNTGKKAVVVADSSIGRWIEGYSQRRVLLELPPYQIFIVGELERYFASNTIMHANIVMVNQYIRVWDDAPYYSMRTPWIAISHGLDYKNVLYLVDGTVETTFMYAGSNWTESPYKSEILGVRYLARDDSIVKISVTYLSKSLNITRTMVLENESKSLEITYIMKPILKEAEILEARIPVWIPYESTLKRPLYYAGKLYFTVDDVSVELKGFHEFTIGRDEKWSQQRILCIFRPQNNTIEAKLTFTFPNSKRSWWNTRLLSATSDEIIQHYNVSHIVLSKSKDDFLRFLSDPRMEIAYENAKFIVYALRR